MIKVSGPVIWEKDVDTGLRKLVKACCVRLPFKAEIVPRGVVPFLHVERMADGLWMCFEPGFLWDGASGPTNDPPEWTWPPLGHDGCFRLIRRGVPGWSEEMAEPANALFYAMLAERPPDKPSPLPDDASIAQRYVARPARWTWWGVKRFLWWPIRRRLWFQGVDKLSGEADDLFVPERHIGS